MAVIAPLSPPERAKATAAVAAKYRDRPFDFATGATCIHLLHDQMRAFGYSPPEIPHFETPIGAKRALRKLGHKDLAGLLDSILPRIPLAMMRVGDVVLGPGHPFQSVGINAGGGKLLGWHEYAAGLVNVVHDPEALIGAWKLI